MLLAVSIFIFLLLCWDIKDEALAFGLSVKDSIRMHPLVAIYGLLVAICILIVSVVSGQLLSSHGFREVKYFYTSYLVTTDVAFFLFSLPSMLEVFATGNKMGAARVLSDLYPPTTVYILLGVNIVALAVIISCEIELRKERRKV